MTNQAVSYVDKIATEISLLPKQVQAVTELLDDGATVPFISRYRKEATGNLDEVAVIAIRDRLDQLKELDKRRDAIVKSIEDQGKMTDDLKKKISAAETMSKLEDIYLPYKPKRRTRATIAKEKGLEPLANIIFAQGQVDLQAEAIKFVSEEKEVADADAALAGARDIIAEWISEDAEIRQKLRDLYTEQATLSSKIVKGKEEEAAKFKDYFEWSEPMNQAPSHRILAIRRGAKEGFLIFHIQPEQEQAVDLIAYKFVKGSGATSDQVRLAVTDSYKRLLSLSMETEMRLLTKKRADEEAIKVFAENIRELLLASPLGQKAVLALDPGFRTGCKLVCLDPQGKLVFHDTVYPHTGSEKQAQAEAKIKVLVEKFNIEAIAIGNGTAGRETQAFCEKIKFDKPVTVVLVNESGASIYSASEVARDEFPDLDLTVRGSASIGRRLMDPLAELVKIDPKSIGVGQYQHDVDQRALKTSLEDVVASCVNSVGVEINTASKQLLARVSGLSERIAGNIVAHRNENGPFVARKDLLKVAGMGPKTFEQSAGFLRIRNSENPLDSSSVHPESYHIVEQMASDQGCNVADLMKDPALRSRIELQKYIDEKVGLPTLQDIMKELEKPGRDPRKEFKLFKFTEGINEVSDLEVGMKLPGIVTNVTNFGAFVDVGVHQDGLVHISELADKFIENPADIVKVQQQVNVTVISVDLERSRIGLSMKSNPGQAGSARGYQKRDSKPSRQNNRNSKPRNNGRKSSELSNNPFIDFFKDYKPKN